jgi:hypothetical protein
MKTALLLVEKFHKLRDEDFCSKCSAEADLVVTETRHYRNEDDLGRFEDAEIEEDVRYCAECYRAEQLAQIPPNFSPVYEERLREAVSCGVVPVEAIGQHAQMNAGAALVMLDHADHAAAAQALQLAADLCKAIVAAKGGAQ